MSITAQQGRAGALYLDKSRDEWPVERIAGVLRVRASRIPEYAEAVKRNREAKARQSSRMTGKGARYMNAPNVTVEEACRRTGMTASSLALVGSKSRQQERQTERHT